MSDKRKHGSTLTALILAAGLGLAGCGKSSPEPAPAPNTSPGGAEAAKVEKTFASADANLRYPVEETLRIVKAGGYADALPQLRKLAGNARLTPEQKQALQELIQKLETMSAQAARR